MKKTGSFTRKGNSSFIIPDVVEKTSVCPECGAKMIKVSVATGWGSEAKEQCPKCPPALSQSIAKKIGFGNI